MEAERRDGSRRRIRNHGDDLMSLFIESGRIRMTDASGNTRFDTAEKLFIPTDLVTGSIALSNRSATTTWNGADRSSHNDTLSTVVDVTHTLNAVSADANTVRGAFRASASYGGFSASSWYNAGGSYVHMWQGGAFGSPVMTCGAFDVCAAAVYTFICESGFIKLREQVHIYNEPGFCLITGTATNTLTMVGPTLDYKLFAGTFV